MNTPYTTPDWLLARPIAHRGLHNRDIGIIENSDAAFAAAAAHGFAIECDIQLTKDGEAVVFHDFLLDRLTGETGAVIDKNASELAKVTLTQSASKDRIGTLTHMIDLVADRCPIVVEIKSRFNGDLRLTKRLVEVLKGRPERIAVKSFDPRIVAALRMMLPDRPRGIVAMSQYEYPDYATIPADEKRAMANLLHFNEMQPDFISWNIKDLPHAGPHLCRTGLGIPVMTWTVRTAEDRAAAAIHADQMVFEGFLPS
ncbi:MAG: glycerophosphodiester phosphodiesterase family protein [Beijerinckiaceae bacterium]